MRTIILAVLLSAASTACAGTIAPGFSVSLLGPSLPGGSTTSVFTAIDGSDVWMSNGESLFRLDGFGGIAETVDLKSGGPVAGNSASTGLAFDASGAMYVNDFVSGNIFKRPTGGSWEFFADVLWPRTMRFDASDNLIVIGGNGVGYALGTAWEISPEGLVNAFATTQGESFTLDSHGDLIVPHYLGTGIDRVARDGTVTTLFSWDRPVPILYEAIAITPAGNYIVGVNTGYDEDLSMNTSQIIRVNGITGERELLGVNVGDAIPLDFLFHEGLLVESGFGSLDPLGIEGNFDGPLSVPEPSSLALLLAVACGLPMFKLKRPVAK